MNEFKRVRPIAYLGLLIGMMIYAVPKLQIGQGWTLPTVFAICWIALMLIFIAAQLYVVFRVDEETQKELRRIARHRRMETERLLRRSLGS